ncbi:MAG TPA: hypothetical protein GXX42_01435 [Petrimonas sp.]|uniref:hypothetical protein n=1 Tax=Petrimonas sp. TaxID=2023866 RepID=UPI00095BB884|nr:hypothetical protein [Petrimonas sp.]OJV35053.1 MAG: hypothetical protein BGO33_02405 [Bacteroidia bacterium 43-41]HHV84466.1 hypothetical protein [Petrimonas sp.]
MKKFALVSIALIISVSAFSQQRTQSVFGGDLAKDTPAQLNELKLNLGTTIFGLFPEVSYERILGEDFGVGASAGISLNSDDYPLDFAFTPYARWYFGGSSTNLQKYGAGFFIEANGSVFSSGSTGAGLGLALGWKYLTKNNWVGELYFGGGRDFVNDSGYPRMGITIGKRF